MRAIATILALACATAPGALLAAEHGDGHCRELREKLLAKYDADHDGKLSESERAAAKAGRAEHREERQEKLKEKHPELFAKIDTNGDGKLERDEVKAWRAEHHGEGRHHRDGK